MENGLQTPAWGRPKLLYACTSHSGSYLVQCKSVHLVTCNVRPKYILLRNNTIYVMK